MNALKIFENIYYSEPGCTDSRRTLDLYIPQNKGQGFPAFIYFHGGGLESGGKEDNAVIAKYLANKGIAFVSVNYRKYPDAKYPEFIEDAADAVKWTEDNISNFGICTGIYVGGSSAGAYLSMMLCFDEKYLASRAVNEEMIKGYFHDAGQSTKHFNVLRENGVDPRRIIADDAAPIYHVGEQSSYPYMHFVVSDNDIENRYEQTMLMLSSLRHFGHSDKVTHTLMHGSHCAYVKAEDDSGRSVLGKMIENFIKQCEIV